MTSAIPADKTDSFGSDQRSLHSKISLSERLQKIVNSLPDDKLTLLELRDLLGQDGILLFVALLTIVFLVPVSIPGVSTIFGGAILLAGISLLSGWNIWLPTKLSEKKLPADRLRHCFTAGIKWFTRLEKISKPYRLLWLTGNRAAIIANGCSIVLGSLLLMMPFGLIPFSNTLPAIALLFFPIGILQKDGFCVLLGYFFIIATIVYFTILLSGGGYAIYEFLKFMA